MNTPELTSVLGFGTLIIAAIIAALLLLRFLRTPGNRHPMDGEPERNIQQIRDDAERKLSDTSVDGNSRRD